MEEMFNLHAEMLHEDSSDEEDRKSKEQPPKPPVARPPG
jgi:hypothetical protein